MLNDQGIRGQDEERIPEITGLLCMYEGDGQGRLSRRNDAQQWG